MAYDNSGPDVDDRLFVGARVTLRRACPASEHARDTGGTWAIHLASEASDTIRRRIEKVASSHGAGSSAERRLLQSYLPEHRMAAGSLRNAASYAASSKARWNDPLRHRGGSGTDFTVLLLNGTISQAEGSFTNVTGVTSVASAGNANAYSLQINTQLITAQACQSSPDPHACYGWEQFVYDTDGDAGNAFIEYWLENYGPLGTQCPNGWSPDTTQNRVDCFRDSANSVPYVAVPITSLDQNQLTGSVDAGGDWVNFGPPGSINTVSGDNYFPELANQWSFAEFNVFGECCDQQAVFNSGSTITVSTSVIGTTGAPPSCVEQTFTGESNNLTLVGPITTSSVPSPTLEFTESNVPPTGDFTLIKAPSDFTVQARQVSAKPTWPNASFNTAVGTQMGRTRVALCLNPTRLMIDGQPAELGDGKSLSLPGGVYIRRNGSIVPFVSSQMNYIIARENGDSVLATVHYTGLDSWIDVSVGLGRWPAKVIGLLANSNALLANGLGNVNKLALRNGTVLKLPILFKDLYHRYADSWRVHQSDSILRDCGDKLESGIPQKPLYAQDLNSDQYKHAREICSTAGVKNDSLLDACALDVTVLGDKTAAEVFAHAHPPRAAMPRPQVQTVR